MEDHEAIEKELLEIVDDVIRQYDPVLKADDIFIDKSPIIGEPGAGHGYTSAVAISFWKTKQTEDGDARSIGHIFDVLLFLKGKAEDVDVIRRAMVFEFEWFMENLKDGKIHWL